MPRRRRVLLIALLLLVLLGAGGGYRLANGHRPSPVLRTVTVGLLPEQVVVDSAIDRAFVSNTQDKSVSVLDARSGTVLRTVQIGDNAPTLVVDVPTGRLIVRNSNNPSDFVLDAASGAIVGTWHSGPGFNGPAAVDPRTGHFFLTNAAVWAGTSAVVMFDGRTGALLHSTALAGNLPMSEAVDARTDRVFAVDANAYTASMVQASSGRLLRTVTVGSAPVYVAVDTQTGRAFIPNAGANTVSVLDARSGAVLRTVPVAPHPAAAVVDERTARAFLLHGRVLTQSTTWSGLVPPSVLGPQAGPVGVTVLDARTGAVLRTLPVGGDLGNGTPFHHVIDQLAVDVRRNRVIVINRVGPGSTGDGSVSVLDARTGRVLQTIGVGRLPTELAVDEATARLFVVNSNAGCVRPRGLWQFVPSFARRLLPFLLPPLDCNVPGTVSVIDTSRL